MRRTSQVWSRLVATVLVGAASCLHADVDEAWQTLSRLMTNEARAEFESLAAKESSEQSAARLGLAVTLLNKQPKTQGNLDEAAELLDAVSASEPGDLGMLAGYFRARIEQAHRMQPDPVRAEELYEAVIARDPEHPVAQLARVKSALILIYGDGDLESKRALLARLEQQAGTLTFPPARRDMHVVLADAYAQLFQDDEATLRCMLEAEAVGFINARNRADHWIRIAELARRTGKADVALDYYRRFLKTFRRDERHHTVGEQAAALEAALRS